MRGFTTALLLVTALAACGGDTAGNSPRPSVLLVTIDTLRADRTPVEVALSEAMPNLTRLAARGAAFSMCESQHPETGPSISSIMTSRYPRETGVRENGAVLPPEFPCVAEVYRDAGYRTGAFVSTYLLKPHACGLDRGFDTYDHEMNAANLGHENFERRAEDTVARALAWLEAGDDRPFFLWVHLYDPHGLYDPGQELAKRFFRDTDRPDLPPGKIVSYQRFGDSLDPDDYEARYDGEVFRADRALGRLLEAVGEEAIVAVGADHGEGLGEDDYWYRHGSLLNEAALHVPLVLAGPGVPAGRFLDYVVRNLDTAPTLLDLCGLPTIPDARGSSLVPMLCGDESRDRISFAEARRMGGVSDRTGVDTRYKVSVHTGWAERVVIWPKTGELQMSGIIEDREKLAAALRRWLTIGDRLPGEAAAADVNEALRGLGYLEGRKDR